MADVRFDNASRTYPGAGRPAVDGLTLKISDGEFLVLVGPSGSGKSTALRMLAGLEPVDRGSVSIGGRDVTLVPPKDRDIAMVFQNYALYPHMDVAANMGFALKQQGVSKEERADRVREVARILDLEPFLDRKPKSLSGGQRQRVAMGRAIVRRPRVFLMDEPLSNLDAKLRVQTRSELADLQARLGVTTVYVTHDQVEAMTMGHRVAVLNDGVLQQVAAPGELYRRPANLFVAGFIGSPAMNLVESNLSDGTVLLGSTRLALDSEVRGRLAEAPTSTVTVGIRPEALVLSSEGMPAEVIVVEELGSETFVFVNLKHRGETTRLLLRTDGDTVIARGDRVQVEVRGTVHVFNERGDRISTAGE